MARERDYLPYESLPDKIRAFIEFHGQKHTRHLSKYEIELLGDIASILDSSIYSDGGETEVPTNKGGQGMGIPAGIEPEHVQRAIQMLQDGHQLTHNFGPSITYDVLSDGQRFPPKKVVALAAELATGVAIGPGRFNGGESPGSTNPLLRRLGFTVIDKEGNIMTGDQVHKSNLQSVEEDVTSAKLSTLAESVALAIDCMGLENIGNIGRLIWHQSPDGQIIHLKYSKYYENNMNYWYGVAPESLRTAGEKGITHFGFITGNRGCVLVALETLLDYVTTAKTSVNKDGDIRHFHFFINSGNPPAPYQYESNLSFVSTYVKFDDSSSAGVTSQELSGSLSQKRDLAIELIREGVPVKDIAKRIKVKRKRVRKWRKQEGLTSAKRGRPPSSKRAEAIRMVREGISDADVARRVGVHVRTVGKWKEKAGLTEGKRELKTHQLREEAVQMIRDGITGAEVSRRLGVSQPTISNWRKQEGLSGVSGTDIYSSEHENNVIDLFRQGKSQAEISRITGISSSTIRKWRTAAIDEGFLSE